jgi:hypothetical protein
VVAIEATMKVAAWAKAAVQLRMLPTNMLHNQGASPLPDDSFRKYDPNNHALDGIWSAICSHYFEPIARAILPNGQKKAFQWCQARTDTII